jgi:hypothetical protein
MTERKRFRRQESREMNISTFEGEMEEKLLNFILKSRRRRRRPHHDIFRHWPSLQVRRGIRLRVLRGKDEVFLNGRTSVVELIQFTDNFSTIRSIGPIE